MIALVAPSGQPRGQIASAGATGAAEQFAQVAQPAVIVRLSVVGVDGVGDHRPVVGVEDFTLGGEQLGDPFGQEGAVDRRVGHRQGIEARGLTGRDDVVAAADGADERLGATVLVEIGDAGLQPLGLGQQEGEQHRLAGAGGADDGEIAQVAVMEVEVIGTEGRGLQDRYCRAPVIALGLAGRVVVEAGKTCEIAD